MDPCRHVPRVVVTAAEMEALYGSFVARVVVTAAEMEALFETWFPQFMFPPLVVHNHPHGASNVCSLSLPNPSEAGVGPSWRANEICHVIREAGCCAIVDCYLKGVCVISETWFDRFGGHETTINRAALTH